MPIEMTSLLELPDGSHLRVNAGNGLDLRGLWGATRETRYTDGSPGGFLVKAPHRLVRHPESNRLFWVHQARTLFAGPVCGPPRRSWLKRQLHAILGRTPAIDLGELWRQAPHARRPHLEEIQRAVDEGLAEDPTTWLTLRLKLWWKWAKRPEPERPARVWMDNLRELLPLLPETADGGTLLKVEVCRQLGDFKAARHWLDWPVTPRLQALRDFQHNLIACSDTARHDCSFCFPPPMVQQHHRRRRSSST